MAMSMRIFLIAGLWIVGSNAGSSHASSQVNQSFSEYMQAFGKNYVEGTAEHRMREQIFAQRMGEILAHNAAGHPWKMGLNLFTDYTDAELQSLRGYRRPHKGTSSLSGTSVMEVKNDIDDKSCAAKDQSCSNAQSCCGGLICGASASCVEPAGATEAMDWSSLSTSFEVYNQGGCGSCWAVAAAAAVQLMAAKQEPKFNKVLSPEDINKCAPNPLACGGTGGCQGSTPGLGFDHLKEQAKVGKGLTSMDKMPYTASTGMEIPEPSCKATSLSFLQMHNLRSRPQIPYVTMADWIKVKDNHAEQVMKSLVNVGPLAVAVVGSGIQGYAGGVIDNCKSSVIDHAVVMMGYGKDQHRIPAGSRAGSFLEKPIMYWNIRNSWGKEWGENGFFKLQRFYTPGTPTTGDPMTDAKFQGEPCSDDLDPAKGVACKDNNGNYPTKTRVCGVCGIVSDVAHPAKVSVDPGLLV